jgi:phosphate-selective porin OprO and OprP
MNEVRLLQHCCHLSDIYYAPPAKEAAMSLIRSAAALLLALLPFAAHAEGLNPRLSANLQYDWISFKKPEPRPLRDLRDWRRQEIALLLDLPGGGAFKAEYDFEAEIWTDLYLRGALGPVRTTVGQFKTPYGMEFLTSSRALLFTENSVAGAFAIGRRLGVMGEWLQPNRGLQLALYGPDIEGAGADNGIAARGFHSFGAGSDALWHAGLALATESPREPNARIRLRPELRSPDPAWLDSGTLAELDGLHRGSAELAWQRGPLLLQGEWLQARFSGERATRSLRGGYAQASYTLYGDARSYKDGIFGTPKPVSGLGAVEVALRYSHISLPLAAGGERQQDDVSLGLNLQYGPFLRLMVDRHHADRDRGAPSADLWSVRAAVMF